MATAQNLHLSFSSELYESRDKNVHKSLPQWHKVFYVTDTNTHTHVEQYSVV
jgi:hypothetical protein